MDLSIFPGSGSCLNLQPHHIWRSVLVYVLCRETCDDSKNESAADALAVAKLDAYLIDTPEDDEQDIPLASLLADIDRLDPSGKWTDRFCRRCCCAARECTDVYALHCLIQDLREILAAPSGKPPLLHPSSFSGLFVTDVLTSFESLSFEKTCDLHARCYYHAQQCQHPVFQSGPSSMPGTKQRRGLLTGANGNLTSNTASPIVVHTEETAEMRDSTCTITPLASRVLSASTPLDASRAGHDMDTETPSSFAATAPPPFTATSGYIANGLDRVLDRGVSPCFPADALYHELSSCNLSHESRLSLADVNPDHLSSEFTVVSPPLHMAPPVANRQSDQQISLQEVTDDLFLALHHRDWYSVEASHHELVSRNLPQPRQLSSEEDSAAARRSDACNAIRHCGLATKELSRVANALGYREEATVLRKKAIQVALVTDDKDSLYWALSDVLSTVHPASHEADVLSQQLLARAEDGSGESVRHLAHLWRSWHSICKGNVPMHTVVDELGECWSIVQDKTLHYALPQLFSIFSTIYQVYGYGCCSQLFSQMLLTATYGQQPSVGASKAVQPQLQARVEGLRQLCETTTHLAKSALTQGDFSGARRLLAYSLGVEETSSWSVSIKEDLSAQHCAVCIEESVLQCRWAEARRWVSALAGHNQHLATYHEARLFHELNDTHPARVKINQLISTLERDSSQANQFDKDFTPLLLAKSLQLLCEILVASKCEARQISGMIDKCMSLCKSYNLNAVLQSTVLTKVKWQLSCKSVEAAMASLHKWMPQILAHSDLVEHGRAFLLYARAVVKDKPEEASRSDLNRASVALLDSETILVRCQAKKALLSLYHWKCRVCRALEDRASCLSAARAFSSLQQDTSLQLLA